MSDLQTFLINPLLTSALVYWGLSGCWLLMDLFWAPKNRVSGGEVIDWRLYRKTAIHVLKLQSTTPIVLYALIPIWKYRGNDTSWESFLSLETFSKLLLCSLLSDVVFYISHRICHLKIFYKHVHKKHHEWVVPCALAAAYSTFYEYLLCSLPTFLVPPLIVNINWYGAQIWFVIATISVVNDHSGYTFLRNSIHHTNHHKYQNYNYGSSHLDSLGQTSCSPNKRN